MRSTLDAMKLGLAVSTAVALCGAASGAANAGGFAIREQSAQFQGSSFAGNAAGGGLSSMFWNPAALGQAGAGLTSESHFAGIWGQANNTVETRDGVDAEFLLFGDESGNIGIPALVGASYYSYKLSDRLTLGMSMNSGFGLSTKPRDLNYLGAELGRTTKLFTLNAAPTMAYKIAPGITVGAGVQMQYAKGKLQVATGGPPGPTSQYKGDDFAFGFTAGILIEPTSTTSIGLGYRSQLSHELEGRFRTAAAGTSIEAEAGIDLPDIVTLSIRQSLAPNMRLLGSIEWSNWSRFEDLTLTSTAAGSVVGVGGLPSGVSFASIPANWSDGWFFALGGEYDLNPAMTLRAGVAYELSPVDSAEKRIVTIPDNDRVWLSAGASIKLTETMSADFAYTHVFIKNGDFDRESLTGVPITGHTEAQADIFAASLKTTWGGGRPLEPMK